MAELTDLRIAVDEGDMADFIDRVTRLRGLLDELEEEVERLKQGKIRVEFHPGRR